MTNNEETSKMKTAEEYKRERVQQMCSSYMELYGPKKRHTLRATREEAERFRGLEPTITVIDEECCENI